MPRPPPKTLRPNALSPKWCWSGYQSKSAGSSVGTTGTSSSRLTQYAASVNVLRPAEAQNDERCASSGARRCALRRDADRHAVEKVSRRPPHRRCEMAYAVGVPMEGERAQYERVAATVAAPEIRDQRFSLLCGCADPLPGEGGRVPLERRFGREQLLELVVVAAIERPHERGYGRADVLASTCSCEVVLGQAWSSEPGGADRDDEDDRGSN